MLALFYGIGLFCLAGVGFWFLAAVLDDAELENIASRKDVGTVVICGPAVLCVLLVVVYVVPNRTLVASIGGTVVVFVVCVFAGAWLWDQVEKYRKQKEGIEAERQAAATREEEKYVEQVNGYGDIPPEIVEKQKEWRRHV